MEAGSTATPRGSIHGPAIDGTVNLSSSVLRRWNTLLPAPPSKPPKSCKNSKAGTHSASPPGSPALFPTHIRYVPRTHFLAEPFKTVVSTAVWPARQLLQLEIMTCVHRPAAILTQGGRPPTQTLLHQRPHRGAWCPDMPPPESYSPSQDLTPSSSGLSLNKSAFCLSKRCSVSIWNKSVINRLNHGLRGINLQRHQNSYLSSGSREFSAS